MTGSKDSTAASQSHAADSSPITSRTLQVVKTEPYMLLTGEVSLQESWKTGTEGIKQREESVSENIPVPAIHLFYNPLSKSFPPTKQMHTLRSCQIVLHHMWGNGIRQRGKNSCSTEPEDTLAQNFLMRIVHS